MKKIVLVFSDPETFAAIKSIVEEKEHTEATLFDITQTKNPLFSVDELNKINYAEEIFIHFDKDQIEPFKQELANKLALRLRNKKDVPLFSIIYTRKKDQHPKTFRRIMDMSKSIFLKQQFIVYFNKELFAKFEKNFSEAKPIIVSISKTDNIKKTFEKIEKLI